MPTFGQVMLMLIFLFTPGCVSSSSYFMIGQVVFIVMVMSMFMSMFVFM